MRSHSPESNPNEPISQVTVTSLEAQQAELLALLQSLIGSAISMGLRNALTGIGAEPFRRVLRRIDIAHDDLLGDELPLLPGLDRCRRSVH